MRSRLLKIFPILTFLVLFFSTIPSPVSAQTTQVWTKPGSVCVAAGTDVATIQGLQCLIGNLLSIAITGIGFAGFVMMIIGSFRYLLSGGNAKGVEAGKNAFTFAIVGLVVALSAFMAVKLVSDFTGVTSILRFQIPTSDKQWSDELN